ncbi:MAG: adenosylcobinamide-phosphate synthase CbiB [Oscillospiraceae bacterium]|jgi:adenosylcobinamide-phosphate synthase
MNILKHLLPVAFALILDTVLGDPDFAFHPIRLIGKLISSLEKVLRTAFPKHEKISGMLLVIAVLIISTAVPLYTLFLCYRTSLWLGIAAESMLCFFLIAAKSLKAESMRVHTALSRKKTEEARKALSMIVGRDTQLLDETGIIKATVETVAENTSDGVTAPILFILLGGAPAGFFYKAANTMDSMIGYKNEKYVNFGCFAAKLDDILNFIPSRLTAIFMILSAYILGYNGKNAYKIWRRDRFNHASPNAAQTEAACAGALDIMLAGDAYYFGKLYKKKTIGDSLRPVEYDDIRRSNRLMYCTFILILIFAITVKTTAWLILGGLL